MQALRIFIPQRRSNRQSRNTHSIFRNIQHTPKPLNPARLTTPKALITQRRQNYLIRVDAVMHTQAHPRTVPSSTRVAPALFECGGGFEVSGDGVVGAGWGGVRALEY